MTSSRTDPATLLNLALKETRGSGTAVIRWRPSWFSRPTGRAIMRAAITSLKTGERMTLPGPVPYEWRKPYHQVEQISIRRLDTRWGGDLDDVDPSDTPEVDVLGAIEFVTSRSVSPQSTQWLILAPGIELMGDHDEWEAPDIADDSVQDNDPFWLLALMGGVVEHEDGPAPEEAIGWTMCRGIADLNKASATVGRPMADGLGWNDEWRVGERRWRFNALLDSERRFRRIGLPDQGSAIELGDFGAAIVIPSPPEDQIWRPTDDDHDN